MIDNLVIMFALCGSGFWGVAGIGLLLGGHFLTSCGT